MKIRNKDTGIIATSNKFNTHGLGEILVTFRGGEASSEFISDYDVQLKDASWIDLHQALKDHIVISDNYSKYFKEAETEEERERGFYL